MPAPCRDELDEVCGRHLDGTGRFAIAEPRAAVPITGLREDGVYEGGAGDIVLPLVMGGRTVWLPLTRARAELHEISENLIAGKLGGAVLLDDIHRLLIPAYADAFRAVFAADCTVGGELPGCGCPANSAGGAVVGMFDRAPTADCRITDEEVARVAAGILTADVDPDGDGINDALSWGVGIEAQAGQFPP